MLSCAAWPLAGCQAEDPHNGKFDLDVPIDSILPPDGALTCQNTTPLAAPLFSPPPPASTNYALHPFRGKAMGATKLYAQVGASTSTPVNVNLDGTFCIEVQLIPDAFNTVNFTPLDSNGCPGISTNIKITHKSAPKIDAGIPTIQNVAKGQPASQQYMDSGQELSYVFDGDASSSAKFSFFDTGTKYAWIRVDLGKSYTVSKLKIRYPSSVGDEYGKEYQLLVSTKAAPVDPDAATFDWTSVHDTSSGDATDQLIPIAPVSARWVALLLFENGGWSALGYEHFQISELEVWGQDPNAQPPPPPDSCNK
jgi:hypothetical protein